MKLRFDYQQKLFDIINPQIIQPDLLIYLHSPVSKLQQNIKKRNRSFEQGISDDYLFSIQENYTQYIKQHNIKTVFVDVTHADFINNESHLKAILDVLENNYENGQHYITLA